MKYADEPYYAYQPEFLEFVKEEIRDAFIAGAKWGAEHLHPEKMLGGVYSSYDMAKTYVEGQNNILTNLDKYNLMRKPKSEPEKLVPNDLEEAAEEFAKDAYLDKHNLIWMFKRGAKWQKEQMMKEAIPCKVFWHDGPLLDYTQEQQDNALERIGANVGDKIKLIIVKED